MERIIIAFEINPAILRWNCINCYLLLLMLSTVISGDKCMSQCWGGHEQREPEYFKYNPLLTFI